MKDNKILNFIKENPGCSTNELVSKWGVVHRNLKRLYDASKVFRVSASRVEKEVGEKRHGWSYLYFAYPPTSKQLNDIENNGYRIRIRGKAYESLEEHVDSSNEDTLKPLKKTEEIEKRIEYILSYHDCLNASAISDMVGAPIHWLLNRMVSQCKVYRIHGRFIGIGGKKDRNFVYYYFLHIPTSGLLEKLKKYGFEFKEDEEVFQCVIEEDHCEEGEDNKDNEASGGSALFVFKKSDNGGTVAIEDVTDKILPYVLGDRVLLREYLSNLLMYWVPKSEKVEFYLMENKGCLSLDGNNVIFQESGIKN